MIFPTMHIYAPQNGPPMSVRVNKMNAILTCCCSSSTRSITCSFCQAIVSGRHSRYFDVQLTSSPPAFPSAGGDSALEGGGIFESARRGIWILFSQCVEMVVRGKLEHACHFVSHRVPSSSRHNEDCYYSLAQLLRDDKALKWQIGGD
jgi:hypothetical protein